MKNGLSLTSASPSAPGARVISSSNIPLTCSDRAGVLKSVVSPLSRSTTPGSSGSAGAPWCGATYDAHRKNGLGDWAYRSIRSSERSPKTLVL